ncbi:hypothetical protein [Brachybacterium nesterenkovii]|uniref:hypothetical protein n=1 Tax=Brachybacterium nesterenkovii TaxID=47847 RepID=UPI00321B42E0
MPITVEDLLVGPRGRRFLLELAVRCDPTERLHSAQWETVRVSFPQSGSVYCALIQDDDGTRRTEVIHPDARPDPTAFADPTGAGFAALLTATALREPAPADLRLALAAAVANARYWQEPDGEDALAADPTMRPALARVAEHALSHLPSWWSGPVGPDVEHMVVEFEDEEHPPAPPADRAGIARALSEDLREEAACESSWWSTPPAAVPVTSTVRPCPDGTTEIPGVLFVEDGSGWTRGHCLPAAISTDVRVLTIDGPEDWGRMVRRYPLAKGAPHGLRRRVRDRLRSALDRRWMSGDTWAETTGRTGAWAMPDWAAIAREVDAVHLTVRGYLMTAGRPLPVDGSTATLLAGFSPDQTIRFSPVDVDRDRAQTWALDDDDQEIWAPTASSA